MASQLPEFPASREGYVHTSPRLLERGLTMRHAVTADIPFLRALYASTRHEELAATMWPTVQKKIFLESQFDLQHRHYTSHFAQADFLVIERSGQPIGRMYVRQQPPAFHIIDIALVPDARGAGLGGCLIAHVQQDAFAAGHDVHLNVNCRNSRARQLYERLGFVTVQTQGAYMFMRWTTAIKLNTPPEKC